MNIPDQKTLLLRVAGLLGGIILWLIESDVEPYQAATLSGVKRGAMTHFELAPPHR